MLDLKQNGFISTDGAVLYEAESIRLHVEGTVFGQKFYGEQKSYTFLSKHEFVTEDYFVLEYAAQGLRRQLSYRQAFIFALTEEGCEKPLVCYDDVILDNGRHSIIVKAGKEHYVGIKLVFYIDRRLYADFSVYEMYTCCEEELPQCASGLITEEAEPMTPISLDAYFNSSFETDSVMIDGGVFFKDEQITLHHIPFMVQKEGNNLIVPPPAPTENDESIVNFGVKTKRGLCRPVSRDK